MQQYLDKLDKATLAFYERKYLNRKQQIIEVKVDKKDVERISFLLENEYRIIGVTKKYYELNKNIVEQKSFRISLTESCNYKCFFCHEEGMEMNAARREREMEKIYQTSLEAINNGFLDITFTGGEPLIKWKWVVEFLKRYNSLSIRPDITIVTNGVLINDTLLDVIENYKGKFKFNFSMHHTDREKYYNIVLPKDNNSNNFDIVTKNIQEIISRNIDLKLNFVILNEINNSRDDLECILNYAVKNKVKCIKFLEFLVTDKLLDKYNYYFTLESLFVRIKDLLILEKENLRTKYYRFKNTDLIIELSHCTCAIGCSKCILAKDVTVTSELRYFPCFFRSSKGYNLDGDFFGAIKEGEDIIKKFSKEYGDKTPFKVSGEKFIDKRIDYVYHIKDCKKDNLLKKLNNIKLERTREYLERLYGDSPYPGVVKLYKNHHENNYYEVVKELKRNRNRVENTFLYGAKERKVEDLQVYERHLKYMGIRLFGEVEWKTKYYSTSEGNIMVRNLNEGEKVYLVSDYFIDVNEYNEIREMDRSIEEDVYFRGV